MAAFAIPAAGAVASIVGGLLSNRSPKQKERQVQRFTPEQQGLLNQYISGGTKGIPQGFDYIRELLSGSPEAFSRFEQPFKTQFNQETVPNLAARFAGMGSGNLSSSGFQQALAQAGSSLSEKLASLRGGLQMQALGHLGNLSSPGLTPSFESILSQGSQGFGGSIAPALGQIGGMGLNYGLMNLLRGRGNPSPGEDTEQVDFTGGGPVAQSSSLMRLFGGF